MHRITLLFELVETLHLLLCLVPGQQLSEIQHSECFCFVAARVKISVTTLSDILYYFATLLFLMFLVNNKYIQYCIIDGNLWCVLLYFHNFYRSFTSL